MDRDADADADPGYGYNADGDGTDRDDTPFADARQESFMPMTRRDVDHLTHSTLRDTSKFLKSQEPPAQKPASFGAQTLTIAELFGGAVVGGYLSQRFRGNGGVLPVGLLLGGLAFAAAQLTSSFGKYSGDVKNVAIGSALASGVIWAASYGAKAKDEANLTGTGNALPPPPHYASPQQLASPPVPPIPQPPPFPQQQWPQQSTWSAASNPAVAAPSMVDFQHLVMQRGA